MEEEEVEKELVKTKEKRFQAYIINASVSSLSPSSSSSRPLILPRAQPVASIGIRYEKKGRKKAPPRGAELLEKNKTKL